MDSKINRIIYRSSIQLLMTGITLLGISLAVLPLGAQKYDNQWLLGYPPNDSTERFGGTLLSFGKDTIYTTFKPIANNIGSNAQICDSLGNLILFSNGCDIFNRNMEQINQNPLGYNNVYDIYCPRGYPLTQGILILPDLYNRNKYYLFRALIGKDFIPYESLLSWTLEEKYIDQFAISTENRLIEDDVADQITAVQHGNGKDWWLLNPKVNRGYYITKIGRNGPETPIFQDIGIDPPIKWRDNGASHACFSPDGNTYVSSSRWTGVRIFNFDRCEGTLYNPRFIHLDHDTANIIGVAISPNNQFLYLGLSDRILQYDLLADDIANSGVRVAVYDGHQAPFPTNFYQMMLTPNDRIIVSSTSGVFEFTQILEPNLRGKDCNVQQHSLKLKTHATQKLPNFPNLRAGRLKGSPCDTLFTTNVRTQTAMPLRIFPNPVTDRFEVDLTDGYDRLELFDINGRLVQTQYQKAPVAVSGLPEGLYVVHAWKGQQLVGIGKVAVLD